MQHKEISCSRMSFSKVPRIEILQDLLRRFSLIFGKNISHENNENIEIKLPPRDKSSCIYIVFCVLH